VTPSTEGRGESVFDGRKEKGCVTTRGKRPRHWGPLEEKPIARLRREKKEDKNLTPSSKKGGREGLPTTHQKREKRNILGMSNTRGIIGR